MYLVVNKHLAFLYIVHLKVLGRRAGAARASACRAMKLPLAASRLRA